MSVLYRSSEWLYELPWSVALRESDNAYPLIETIHVLSIAVMVGTVVAVDLRVLGLFLRQEPVSRVCRALLPVTWYGFAIMLITGIPLFAAQAVHLYSNPAFRFKIILLSLAGANAVLFHRARAAPLLAKACASSSIALWSAIIVSGRLIAVFHAH